MPRFHAPETIETDPLEAFRTCSDSFWVQFGQLAVNLHIQSSVTSSDFEHSRLRDIVSRYTNVFGAAPSGLIETSKIEVDPKQPT